MISKVFSVYDSKVMCYLPPFVCRGRGEAIRSFTDACNGGGPFARHKDDFTLIEIGEFDDSNGMFKSSHESIVTVMQGREVEVEPR